MANKGEITPESVALERAMQFVEKLRMAPGVHDIYDAIQSASKIAGEYLMAQQQLDSMTGSQSEKEKQNAKVVAMVQFGIDRDIAMGHVDFMNNGFHGMGDLERFGGMLGDDNYWAYLQENPEERRRLAEGMVTGAEAEIRRRIEAGEITPDQAEEALEEIKDRMAGDDPERRRRVDIMMQEGGAEQAIERIRGEYGQLKTAEEKREYAENLGITAKQAEDMVATSIASRQAKNEAGEGIDEEKNSSMEEIVEAKEEAKDAVVKRGETSSKNLGLDMSSLDFLDEDNAKQIADNNPDFKNIASNLQESHNKENKQASADPSQEISKPQKSGSIDIGNMG